MTNAAAGQEGGEQKSQFGLQRIYLKDFSFEAPGTPSAFKKEWKPEIKMDMNNKSGKVEDDFYEVVLSVTLTVKNADEVAYIVEIHQAGLFLIKGVEENQLPHLLGSYCPGILFPYAREAVSDVVSRGSFPQMLLAPVNFDALFAESMKRRQQQQAAASQTSH